MPLRDEVLPEPPHEYVTADGQAYRLRIGTHIVNARAFDVTVTHVGESKREFEAYLQYERGIPVLSPTEFTADQREIISQALADRYREEYTDEEPYGAPLQTIVDRVSDSSWDPPEGMPSGGAHWQTYPVMYDGNIYTVTISKRYGGHWS